MSKKSTDKKELFETMPVTKAVLTMTIPMIIASIVSIVYNLVDTYFVGLLNDPTQNAAVTLAAPAMILFYGVTNIFGIGSSSLMSRSLGTKEYERTKRASATGIYLGLLAAFLLGLIVLIFNDGVLSILGTNAETYGTTKGYLFWTVCMGSVPGIMNILMGYLFRAEGRSMHASIGTMSGCVLNIILDPIFILPSGLNMGIEGAGLTTFISNCFACLYFLVYLIINRKSSFVCINPKYITLKSYILKEIFFVGAPGGIQNLLNVVSVTVNNNIAAGIGTAAVAAIGIVSKVDQLPIQIVFGFSSGVMPLIGYNFASGNHPRMKEAIRKTFAMMLGCLITICIIYILFGAHITRFFLNVDDVVRIGHMFFIGFGLAFPFMCIDFMVVGVSQAFGIGKYALIFAILRKAVFETPFMLIGSALFGLYGLCGAQALSEAIMCVISLFLLKKLYAFANKER